MADSTAKIIGGIIPGLMATSLVAQNLKSIPKVSYMKKTGKMKFKPAKNGTKNMLKMGVTNMVGIGLISPTAKMINDL